MNGQYVLQLIIEKNSRNYFFVVPIGSPYEEANEVAVEFGQQLLQMQKQAQEQAANQSSPEPIEDAPIVPQ